MKNQRLSLSLNQILVRTIFLLTLLWLFTGCSSKSQSLHEVAREASVLQKPTILNSSKTDDRPEWTKKSSFEKDGNIYFSGGFLNGSDYSVSVRCANAEALKLAAQSISNFIRVEFTDYVQGPNTAVGGIDRYVEDGIAIFIDNLHLQGVKQKEIYYEEAFYSQHLKSTYNVFVSLEISMVDYLKAKADMLQNLSDNFSKQGNIEAKNKAEKLLEDLKKEIGNEA
ncbi:hypothetical protein D1BOALGB6SA_6937 [Olavius sp. associated proteobacterium Delta 1]|nr:hypothetical protein D1BOALGB6SA_6937 [Olavius sp. associated proteobacterium Delta 1]